MIIKKAVVHVVANCCCSSLLRIRRKWTHYFAGSCLDRERFLAFEARKQKKEIHLPAHTESDDFNPSNLF
jgi:hypothetical protein